jgi:orotate phosphoribosyltransferase-like protein
MMLCLVEMVQEPTMKKLSFIVTFAITSASCSRADNDWVGVPLQSIRKSGQRIASISQTLCDIINFTSSMSRSASLSAPGNRGHHLNKVVRLSAQGIHPTTSMRQIPKLLHEMLILSGTERAKAGHYAQSRVDILQPETPDQCHTTHSPATQDKAS